MDYQSEFDTLDQTWAAVQNSWKDDASEAFRKSCIALLQEKADSLHRLDKALADLETEIR